MFVEALLCRPGWRHLAPGGGGEINTLLPYTEGSQPPPGRTSLLPTDPDTHNPKRTPAPAPAPTVGLLHPPARQLLWLLPTAPSPPPPPRPPLPAAGQRADRASGPVVPPYSRHSVLRCSPLTRNDKAMRARRAAVARRPPVLPFRHPAASTDLCPRRRRLRSFRRVPSTPAHPGPRPDPFSVCYVRMPRALRAPLWRFI